MRTVLSPRNSRISFELRCGFNCTHEDTEFMSAKPICSAISAALGDLTFVDIAALRVYPSSAFELQFILFCASPDRGSRARARYPLSPSCTVCHTENRFFTSGLSVLPLSMTRGSRLFRRRALVDLRGSSPKSPLRLFSLSS